MDLSKLAGHVKRLTSWVSGAPTRLIQRWEPQRLSALDELCSDLQRCANPDHSELAICFLGSSGVGKSTLINALVDPRSHVVPQGGIGPLTAQATVVRYSAQAYLHAEYHGPRRVNQLVFALDRHCERRRGVTRQPARNLDTADAREIELALAGSDPSDAEQADVHSADARMQSYVSQTRQLITGRQFGGEELPLEYLADSLRAALGTAPRWGYSPLAEHQPLVTQVVDAITMGDGAKRWDAADDSRAFRAEVVRHATGSIAPLIKSLEVGWPAPVLRDGLVLVDLPGIGIANDEYRSVTSAWIRRATAVVLVVDKSGVTEAGADLLRTTGFLNTILHRAPESTSVSPLLRVAAVKLDDVANDARSAFKAQNPDQRPPAWIEFFRKACDDGKTLIRSQLEQVFEQSVNAAPDDETREERRDILHQMAGTMQVYPVSAKEYRKFHEDDPEARPAIKSPEESNIPMLIGSLSELARQHAQELIVEYQSAAQRLFDSIERTFARVQDELSGDERQLARLAELRSALDEVIRPAADELKPRLGATRERLRSTIPKVIENEVERAVRAAEHSMRDYFRTQKELPWATLRATIRRGGVWVRSRPIDLPNDLALRFEEPLALAWSRGALGPLQNALKELASDIGRLLGKVAEWAGAQDGLDIAHVLRFRADVEAEVASLAKRGAIAAEDLSKLAKQQLQPGIQNEIRTACQEFVDSGLDIGRGVKSRSIQFLDELAPRVAQVARTTANRFFRESYDGVLFHVSNGLKRFDDPLSHAKTLLVGGQEHVAKDATERVNELNQVRAILTEMAVLQVEVREVGQ